MNYKHGLAHTRLDNIYKAMKDRCNNPNNNRYKNYGLRGIRICDEWATDKNAFFEWAMKNGFNTEAPNHSLSIDRIDVNKDYSPDNCRFVSMKIQQNNRTNNRQITYNGETDTLSGWAERVGLKTETLYKRIFKYGWEVEKALTTKAVVGRNQFTQRG